MLAGSRAEVIRVVEAADGDAEQARLAAYRGLDPTILLGLALRDMAGNLPSIGTLHVSPDLVTTALAKLAGQPG